MAVLHDTQKERLVLGSVMHQPDVVWAVRDSGLLPDDLFEQTHRDVLALIYQLVEMRIRPTGKAVHDLAVVEKVDVRIGGQAFIAGLEADVALTGPMVVVDAPVYARQLLGLADRRVFQTMGAEIARASEDLSVPADEIKEQVARVVTMGRQRLLGSMKTVADGVDELQERVAAWLRGERVDTVLTGIRKLDFYTGGFGQRELTILAARPGMAKTLSAMRMASNIEGDGGHVGFFSLEMAHQDLMVRELSAEAGIDTRRLKRGDYQGDQVIHDKITAAMFKMRQRKGIHVDDTPGLSSAEIQYRAALLSATIGMPLSLIMIDYSELLKDVAVEHKSDTRLGVVTAARRLKATAKGMETPVLLLSAMNRAIEYTETQLPSLKDLMFGGEFEADQVWCPWWPWKIHGRSGSVDETGIQGGIRRDVDGVPVIEDWYLKVVKSRNGEEALIRLKIVPDQQWVGDPDDLGTISVPGFQDL